MTTNQPHDADGDQPQAGYAQTRPQHGAHRPQPYGEPVYPYYPPNATYDPDARYPGAQYGDAQYPGTQYSGVQYPETHYQGYQGYQQGYGQDPRYQQPYWQYPPQQGYGPAGYHRLPGAPAKRRRHVTVLAGLGALIVAAALVLAGVGFAHTGSSANTVTGSGSALQAPSGSQAGGSGSGGLGSGNSGGSGSGGTVPVTPGGTGSGSTGSTGKTASSTQQVGVVTIVSVLKFQSAESAGTGMILTSDGEVLTNNHVVNGATSITVTVESTGKSYRASVVGTAPTKDVAVLQLKNASGLSVAKFSSSASSVAVGDAVSGVGNAGGTGTLTVATGKVTALDKSITATDETGQEAERLKGLVQVNAPIISGDSGGPLYDSDGEIIGIDTAASTNAASSDPATQTASRAYAIRIDNAMDVVRKIESGVQTTTIHIGLPGFLGIAPVATASGVGVQAATAGEPAAKAGIVEGSVITAIDGTPMTSTTKLHNLLAGKGPGAKVTVSWTDAAGASHTSSVTLATGPAD